MPINKRATATQPAADRFIDQAEGGGHAVRWVRGNRTQITLSIAPELLKQVDAVAQRRHLSRAAFVTVVLDEYLQRAA